MASSELPEDFWLEIEPLLPPDELPGDAGGRPRVPNKLALRGIFGETAELHIKRSIQPKIVSQFLFLLGCGILAQHRKNGVAHILKKRESNKADDEHDDDGLQYALNDKGEHEGFGLN